MSNEPSPGVALLCFAVILSGPPEWRCAGCLRALLRDGKTAELVGYTTKHARVER